MEIVKFLDKTWQEIPEQDNPAMPYEGKKDECLMIFKGRYDRIADGGYVVAFVSPEMDTDITKLGVFWSANIAELFADSFNTGLEIDRCETQ